MSPLLQSLQQSGPLALSILLLLMVCSVSVWTIFINKIFVWKKYRSSNRSVIRLFEDEKSNVINHYMNENVPKWLQELQLN